MNLQLHHVLNLILNKYFRHFYCVFLIGDRDDSHLQFANVKQVAYDITSNTSYVDLNLDCQGFVINSRRAIAILSHLEEQLVKERSGRYHDRRYLLVTTDTVIENIYTLSPMENIKDILIVTEETQKIQSSCTVDEQPTDFVFSFWTHKFVGEKHNEPVLLDSWFSTNSSYLKNADLYPDKTTNFEGRIIRLSSFSYLPYSFVGKSLQTSRGIEVGLLSEYTRRKNLTPILESKRLEGWGGIYDNGTPFGVLGDIRTLQSDIGFGAFLTWQAYNARVDFTAATLMIRVKCLVPKPKLADNWVTPFTQFSLELWCLLAIFVISSSFLLVLIQRKIRKHSSFHHQNLTFADSLFGVCGALLLQTCVIQKRFGRLKGILIFVFLLALIITTSYNTNLDSRMVVPRYQQVINTVPDLAASGLEWGGRTKLDWTGPFEHDDRVEYQQILASFVEKNESELLELGHAGVFGFPIDQLPSGNYAIQKDIDVITLDKLRPMQRQIYSGYLVIVVRKNFVLLPSLNEYILRVAESGLLLYWETEAVMLYRSRLQDMLKYSDEKFVRVPLSWSHVKGVFCLWLAGMVTSLFSLSCELISENRKNRKLIR